MKKVLVLFLLLIGLQTYASDRYILPFSDEYMGYVYDRATYSYEPPQYSPLPKSYNYAYSADIYFDLADYYNGNELPKYKEKEIVFLVFNIKFTDTDMGVLINRENNKVLPSYLPKEVKFANTEFNPIIKFKGIVTREYVASKPSGLYNFPELKFVRMSVFPAEINYDQIISTLKYDTYDYEEPFSTITNRFGNWEGHSQYSKTVDSLLEILSPTFKEKY